MPKGLAEYTLADWRRLRPLTHAYKTANVAMITEAYAARPPREGDLAALRRQIAGRRVAVTVAFNDVEILERQIRGLRALVAGALHMVADNSSNDDRAGQIQALCARHQTPYIRLPRNPWGPKSPSRSHGVALDWIWRRLIRPGRPEAFGFLDHDLVPTEPCDPFEPLTRQPVCGDKRWAARKWYLWAGYCFFRTDYLQRLRVDFGQDWFAGLDTGGGNWRSIYSRLDPAAIEDRPIEYLAIVPGAPVDDCWVERRGSWLHEVGVDRRPELRSAKRVRFLALLDATLERAGAVSR
jgi:hypothetical protein